MAIASPAMALNPCRSIADIAARTTSDSIMAQAQQQTSDPAQQRNLIANPTDQMKATAAAAQAAADAHLATCQAAAAASH